MEKEVFNIFCDESRQDLIAAPGSVSDTNRFCCIGGAMIPTVAREKIKADIKKIQETHGVFGELKWGTVSMSKMDFYLELVDYFFQTPEITFRTVVLDALKINNEIYNQADQELGYYKFYYQLLYHWLDPSALYRVYTDQKTNGDKMRLRELKRILNTAYHYAQPVASIQAIKSEESIVLQIENVLMGAVGYKYNFGKAGKSEAKNRVVNRIEHHLNQEICPTSRYERKFNVFEIQLRGGIE